MQRIKVCGDSFCRGNEPYFIKGFEYAPSTSTGSDPLGGDWSVLCNYDESAIERELAGMAECGANAVRIWFAYADEHWTAENYLSRLARRRMTHFLDACERNGIYVNFTVGGSGTMWGKRRGYNDVFMTCPARVYTEPDIEDAFLADVLTVIASGEIGARPNILGIDLANEPIFGIPSAYCEGFDALWKAAGSDFNGSLRVPGVAAAWERWSREQIGEVQPIPVERDFLVPGNRETLASRYQAFVHDCFRRHARRFAETIRDRWPEVLVTIGFGCGGTGACFEGGSKREAIQTLMLTQNVREMHDGLDFICIHLYDGTDLDRLHFLREFIGSEKPILIQEFGPIPQKVDPVSSEESEADREAQAALWEVGLNGARRFNYAGFMGSNYIDFDNREPTRNTWSRMGIVTRDGRPKPVYDLFRKWALEGERSEDYHPQPLPYEPDKFRHSVQAIGEIYAVWKRSRHAGKNESKQQQ
jgi:hypothetical protein